MPLIPEGRKYEIFTIDPPWRYRSAGHHKSKFRGGPAGHYPTLSLDELKTLDLGQISAENSALFLWGTGPMLPEQIALVETWGWRYVTMAYIWTKINKHNSRPVTGPGYYTRSTTEFVILGIRGKMGRPEDKGISQSVFARRGIHSAKPETVQDRIELLYPQTNKIELFASRNRAGWDCFGLSLDGNDIRDYLGGSDVSDSSAGGVGDDPDKLSS